jgi:exonuclease VII small subunit
VIVHIEEQFSNLSHEQMNTNFSSLGFESNSNFYNPDWSNHSDFSWHAHATENYAPQVDELHHPDYLQSDNPFFDPSSYDYPPKKSSLEETLKEFMELVSQPTIPTSQEQSLEDSLEAFRKTINQPCQQIIDATVANTEAVARLKGQFGHLVAEFNRIEEEEFQSQEMARGQYMFDEDCPSDPHHEHVQATTTFESEEVVEEIFCEPSLEDPLEKSFAQFEFNLDIDMIHEQAKALLDPTSEMRTENGEEEMEE